MNNSIIMENQRVVVVVEENKASRIALQWAMRNFIRANDFIILLYVCPLSRSKKKKKDFRLKGFQLALSFKELCNGIAEAKVEIVVTEGDQGTLVKSIVRTIGASTLVVGLHDESFIYKTPISDHGTLDLNCRILAIKQQSSICGCLIYTEFSQVESRRLCISEAKNSFLVFPVILSMLWRSYKGRKHESYISL